MTSVVAAQDINAGFRFLDIRNGLSNNEVYTVCQDQQGFIWIGTQYGVNRFDGQKFEWITQTSGLASNAVHKIIIDQSGLLWLFSHEENLFNTNGLRSIDLLNPTTREVVSFEKKMGATAPFEPRKVENYFAGADGSLFFFSANRLWRYVSGTDFRNIPLPSGFIPLSAEGRGQVWGASGGHLIMIDTTGKILEDHFAGENTKIITAERLAEQNLMMVIAQPYISKLVFGVFENNDLHYTAPTLPDGFQTAHIRYGEDAKKQLIWLADARHVVISNYQGKILWDTDKYPELVLTKNIHTVFIDRQGVGWIGTKNGLILVHLTNSKFHRYLWRDPAAVPSAKQTQCRGIGVWNDQLFVCTYDGRICLDLKTNTSRSLVNRFEPRSYRRLAIYKDSSGAIWGGGSPLLSINPVNGEEQQGFPIPSESSIWSLFRDKTGVVWTGLNNGIGFFRPAVDDSVHIFSQYNGYNELAQTTVLHFYQDKKDAIWIAAATGLYRLEPGRGIVRRWWSQGRLKDYLPADIFQHITPGKNGMLWIATGNGGLLHFNPETCEYQQFERQNGLSSNNIYAAYEDDFGCIWMSSDYGIMRLTPSTGEVRSFLQENGISNQEFNRISHFRSDDGKIWFGGINGITSFDPKNFIQQTPFEYIPELIFTKFSHLNADGSFEALNQDQLSSNEIELSYNERLFTAEFALLDYTDAEKIRYSYKLEGLHKDWIALRENILRVERLAPGQYILKIRATNPGSDYPTQELALKILIQAPFYMKWWFWLGVIVLIGAVIRERIRSLNRKKIELEHLVAVRTEELRRDKKIIEQQASDLRRLDEMKSRFFANVSHELRTPLTLLLGPIRRLLQRNAPESETSTMLRMMDDNASQLLHRVEDILDLTRLDAGKLYLDEQPAHIDRVLQQVMANFESMAQSKQVTLLLKLPGESIPATLIDREKCKTIISNLLANALKFTPSGGIIELELTRAEDWFTITLSDTGYGIQPEDTERIFERFFQSNYQYKNAPHGSGIGLALCRELAGLMDGRLWAQSPGLLDGKGSTFFFELPVKPPDSQPSRQEENAAVLAERPVITRPAKPVSEERLSILLVEDNTYLQEFIRLELSDYQVTTAENGQEALDWLSKHNSRLPHLIISDVIMPVMDGFEFLEKLKANENWQQIPVIMLTARAEIGDKLTALRIGVEDYILKPFVTDELLARIRNLLERRNARLITRDEPFEESELLPSAAQTWLKEVEIIVLRELGNSRLTQDFLAEMMFISKRQLQRNIRLYTGLSANHFIREIRLNQARLRLESRSLRTVAEVSYAVGYDDQHYFSTVYFDRFGKKPAEYLQA